MSGPSRDGRSLYFLGGGKLFRAAAPFDSEPELLFENRDIVSFEIAPDEKRILAVITSDFDASPPTRVITNWRTLLAKRENRERPSRAGSGNAGGVVFAGASMEGSRDRRAGPSPTAARIHARCELSDRRSFRRFVACSRRTDGRNGRRGSSGG